jgi:hypothetical protein
MKKLIPVAVVSLVFILTMPAFGFDLPKQSFGQVVYVPASWQNISTTGQTSSSRLYIRNIDRRKNIVVKSVKFLDPDGNVVKDLLDGRDCAGVFTGPTSVSLNPLHTTSFITRITTVCVPQFPLDGGRPAWLVEWEAADRSYAVAPLISATADVLTPTSIYGFTGPPFVIIDAESSAGGTVLSEKRR